MSKQTSLDRYALFYEAVGTPPVRSAAKTGKSSRPAASTESPRLSGGGLNQDQVDKLSDDLRSTAIRSSNHS
jgi:hypothetical protein